MNRRAFDDDILDPPEARPERLPDAFAGAARRPRSRPRDAYAFDESQGYGLAEEPAEPPAPPRQRRSPVPPRDAGAGDEPQDRPPEAAPSTPTASKRFKPLRWAGIVAAIVVFALFIGMVWTGVRELGGPAAGLQVVASPGPFRRAPTAEERQGMAVVGENSAMVQGLIAPDGVRLERILPPPEPPPMSAAEVLAALPRSDDALRALPSGDVTPEQALDPLGSEPAADRAPVDDRTVVSAPGAEEPEAGGLRPEDMAVPPAPLDTNGEAVARGAEPAQPFAWSQNPRTEGAAPPADERRRSVVEAERARAGASSPEPRSAEPAPEPSPAPRATPQRPEPRVALAPPQQVLEPPPAAATPAPPEPPAAPADEAEGGWRLQLAAFYEAQTAQQGWAQVRGRFPAQLGGFSPTVERGTAGGRTVYRLQVGPFADRSAAAAACERLKVAGGDCFLVAP